MHKNGLASAQNGKEILAHLTAGERKMDKKQRAHLTAREENG